MAIALLVGIVAVAACKTERTPTAVTTPIPGVYALIQVNGQPIPQTVNVPSAIRIRSGTLTLTDTDWDLHFEYIDLVSGDTTDYPDNGSYTRRGSTLSFESFPYGLTNAGTLADPNVTITGYNLAGTAVNFTFRKN